MVSQGRFATLLALGALLVAAAVPASAQIGDQLSAYTGANAEGYLNPLAEALGANLNDAFYHSAYIPKAGVRFSFEIAVMGVIFADADRTFSATTEPGFNPAQTADAPTVVGSGTAATVNGSGGTTFTFPGGFDLNSFAIAVPQIRFGSLNGTEGIIRFFAMDTGDAELGHIQLFGIGARHSISQYLVDFPLDLAVGAMWQSFDLGDNLISSKAFTIGAQASKEFSILTPYGGFSIDTFAMNVDYEDSGGTSIELDFNTSTTAHLTMGVGANLLIGSAFVEYNVASQNSFAFGLGFGR